MKRNFQAGFLFLGTSLTIAFGAIVAAFLLKGITLAKAVLSLTLICMIPVAISLIGMKLNTETVFFLGWFGPGGLASVVLLLTAMEETGGIGGSETVSLSVITTVFLNVFVQGATDKRTSDSCLSENVNQSNLH
ncbi:Na+/H+ antiporter [Methanosarcina horonobensis HB-1 = JCM 15518]|uniref:Na+/H+ antiporter n=1 Tax=Methanosarcina horonobensis HB-1 = JCM 15518 TaxID=1434110 RepID=A0A0E3WUI5_9EURY|nr:hypothetical protein [Methanosarcina horonobensis]AKB78140.1 Na+/H+ antiporter [Methanosarcina horonobensis HB-1 = JCM 15518]